MAGTDGDACNITGLGLAQSAGVLALSWGGLARVLEARREHLVLPADIGEASLQVPLAVMEPKTRFQAARHQCLKVDQPQLVKLIILLGDVAFGFEKLLWGLSLMPGLVPGVRDFDLASLRAGGAGHREPGPG